MKFFVTGATGLVGSHAVDLLLARGHSVLALARGREAAEELRSRGIEVCLGDLSDEDALAGAVRGSDVVVHCAGAVDVSGDPELLRDVNVRGTERLLAASARAEAARFVHLSSVAVYGRAQAPVREDAPKRPAGAYGASKWEAEQLVQRFARELDLPAVVLRPCAIYGERDRHAVQALARVRRLPLIPVARGGRRLLDLVHASDVAASVLAAATSDHALGRAFNITDGERHAHRDILRTLGEVTGRRPRMLSVPGPAFAALAGATRLFSKLSERGAKRLGRLGAMDLDLHYDIEAARRELPFEPRIGLEEGLRRTWKWAVDSGVAEG